MRKMLAGAVLVAGLAGCAAKDASVASQLAGQRVPAQVQRVDEKTGVFMRGSWTAHAPEPARMVAMGDIKLITVMQVHEAVPRQFVKESEVAAYLEAVRQFHVTARNLNDIAYHFAVDRAGHVWQCRSLAYESQSVKDLNAGNVGMMVLGDPDAPVPEVQRLATIWLLERLRGKFHVPLSHVYAKRELVNTDEPGAGVMAFMDAYRTGTLAVKMGSGGGD